MTCYADNNYTHCAISLDYVFCFLHRLPEQHDCIYDHKERGRQKALKEMTPVGKKKIGRSFHRMDSRPEWTLYLLSSFFFCVLFFKID